MYQKSNLNYFSMSNLVILSSIIKIRVSFYLVRSRASTPCQNQKPSESIKCRDAARASSSLCQCLCSQKPRAASAKCSHSSISLREVIVPSRAKTIAKHKTAKPSFSVYLDYRKSERECFPVFSRSPFEN